MNHRTIFCKFCGVLIPQSVTVCPNCGSELENTPAQAIAAPIQQPVVQVISPDMKYCQHCAAAIPKAAVICVHCGCQVGPLDAQAVSPNAAAQNMVPVAGKKVKDKLVTALLCIFLGVAGAHKFYEGNIGMGILYFFTMGLFGIGILVDLIILLPKPRHYLV